MENKYMSCVESNLNIRTPDHINQKLRLKRTNIKYKKSLVSGSSQTIYSVPIRFQPENPEVAKPKPKKRALKPYDHRVIVLRQKVIIPPSNLSSLSDWNQIVKTWGNTSYKRVELMCFITLSGISLEKAEPRDRIFLAQCLQSVSDTSNNSTSSLFTQSNSYSVNACIFPLLEQANEAYFNYFNPFSPFFTRADFFTRPRSKLLRLCVWRVGLQYLPSSELLKDLCDNIEKQIKLLLVPSALSFELGTIQGLTILYAGLYDSSLNKYRTPIQYYVSLIVDCLGLYRISPGPLNQERLLTFFTFGYYNSIASVATNTAWCNYLPDFPFQTSTWPNRTYSTISELYKDHPNNPKSSSFATESVVATLDTNTATLCLSTYHFHRLKNDNNSNVGFKSKLRPALTWGTYELQKSKVLQLPNRKLVPLASCPRLYHNSMLVNYPESNRILAQLQLVLHSRYHQASLSTSNPHHTFRLVDLLKLISNGSPFFSRIIMLLDATKYLLKLPRDSKVEQYLGIVRTCLKDMELEENSKHYATSYLLLFEALVNRETTTKSN